MARRTPQTFLKRQREQKRAEKARQKLAKREARKLGLVSEDDTAPGDAPPFGSADADDQSTGADRAEGRPDSSTARSRAAAASSCLPCKL